MKLERNSINKNYRNKPPLRLKENEEVVDPIWSLNERADEADSEDADVYGEGVDGSLSFID